MTSVQNEDLARLVILTVLLLASILIKRSTPGSHLSRLPDRFILQAFMSVFCTFKDKVSILDDPDLMTNRAPKVIFLPLLCPTV